MNSHNHHATLHIINRRFQSQPTEYDTRTITLTINDRKILRDVQVHEATMTARRAYMIVSVQKPFDRLVRQHFLQGDNIDIPSEYFLNNLIRLIRQQPRLRCLRRFLTTTNIPSRGLQNHSFSILEITHCPSRLLRGKSASQARNLTEHRQQFSSFLAYNIRLHIGQCFRSSFSSQLRKDCSQDQKKVWNKRWTTPIWKRLAGMLLHIRCNKT